ncbi:MAG: hypothetical protein J5965_09705 [Aeriscardovia sp.]|nr:hypothetical protein [Aeriscardovia sp.]
MINLAYGKVRIKEKGKSDWWKAIKIKNEWVQVKKYYRIGGDCWDELFAVELENGKHLTRIEFNRHECIEGNDLVGFRVYKPSVTNFI